jgi:hypothetical protein
MRHLSRPIGCSSSLLSGFRDTQLSEVNRSTKQSGLLGPCVRRCWPIAITVAMLVMVALTAQSFAFTPQSSPAITCDPPCLLMHRVANNN